MAYTNPILGAIQSRRAADMQDQQFTASLALQMEQFAENRSNSKKTRLIARKFWARI